MAAKISSTRRDGSGFSAEVTRADARRQLRLSLGVIVMLAVGIVSAAMAVGPHPLAVKRDVVSTRPIVTMHAKADPVGAEAI